jgi:hypothetical protein
MLNHALFQMSSHVGPFGAHLRGPTLQLLYLPLVSVPVSVLPPNKNRLAMLIIIPSCQSISSRGSAGKSLSFHSQRLNGCALSGGEITGSAANEDFSSDPLLSAVSSQWCLLDY